LADYDLVCVHVEATDEASHEGRADEKIKALEQIDRHIVAPLAEALAGYGEHRILVTPDHPTPLRTKTHSHGAVPFVIAGTGIRPGGGQTYDEPTAARSPLAFDEGWKLMGYFLGAGS
jgi:2,3-bisphosphoglycerate-independent phosphoglycerate mutase